MGSQLTIQINRELEKHWCRKFKWGEFDCCLIVADVLKAITGIDYASEVRGKYHTRGKAYRLIGSIEKYMDAHFTVSDEPKTGDVVMINSIFGDALAIHTGIFAATTGVQGVMYRPLGEIKRAWSVL